jgi:UDPglucose 6-dehydrogenase
VVDTTSHSNALEQVMIIGSGIVGQATGKGLIKRGISNVLFVDLNPQVVKSLSYQGFNVCSPSQIKNEIENFGISMFCLPSPFNEKLGKLDLSHIKHSLIDYAKSLRNCKSRNNYHLIVIRSTVPPGTTEKLLIPLIEKYSEMKVGCDFGVCMQPEFLRSVFSEQDFDNPRTIVIGEHDKYSGEVLERLYKFAGFKVPIMRVNLRTAEFVKYIGNYFNATRISFANELWALAKQLGVDSNSALEIAINAAEGFWNPSYGTYGGQPYGGRCLPKDIKTLITFCEEIGVDMPILSAVASVNSKMEVLAKQGEVPNGSIYRQHRGSDPPVVITENPNVISKKLE